MADTPSTEQTPQPLPDSADIHEVAALMDGFDDPEEGDGEPDGGNAQPEGGEVAREAGEEGDGGEQAADSAQEQTADEFAEPPAFWSSEDKAAYATVPPALRPLIHKYEKQRVAFEQEKAREAATVRKESEEKVKEVATVVEDAVKWWQANGPQFFKSFGDKWAGVDWNKLAEENPAEWTRFRQQHDSEQRLLLEANERAQRDRQLAERQAQSTLVERKRAAHEVMVQEMPDHFAGEKAASTYDRLGKYLMEQGIPAERINAISEAPIIRLAMKAMLLDEAKKQASTVVNRDDTTGRFTAKTTPTRVRPGPATRQGAGDQNAELARRVGERFRKSGGASIADAADLIRLNNL